MDTDGDYYHSYCDLTLKFANQNMPVAILELIMTALLTLLDKHFYWVLNYNILQGYQYARVTT